MPAALGGGATGAPAAGVQAKGIASGDLGSFSSFLAGLTNAATALAQRMIPATSNIPYPLRTPITNQALPFAVKNIAPMARLADAAEPSYKGCSCVVMF